MKKFRAAVIGCGNISVMHLDSITHLEGLELAAVCDVKEERAEAQRYFQQLGRGDARTQAVFFSAQAARLNALREQSAREAKARGELYLKLGLLAGLALVVLIL